MLETCSIAAAMQVSSSAVQAMAGFSLIGPFKKALIELLMPINKICICIYTIHCVYLHVCTVHVIIYIYMYLCILVRVYLL